MTFPWHSLDQLYILRRGNVVQIKIIVGQNCMYYLTRISGYQEASSEADSKDTPHSSDRLSRK